MGCGKGMGRIEREMMGMGRVRMEMLLESCYNPTSEQLKVADNPSP